MSDLTCLAIGDPHYMVGNSQDTDLLEEAIYKVIDERHPDVIVVLGDVLDRFENTNVKPFKRVQYFLRKLAEKAPTIVLVGNHDRPNNSDFLTDNHFLLGLKGWTDRLVIVDTTQNVTFPDAEGQKYTFTCVPYVPDGRFLEALSYVPDWKNSTAIFAHQAFYGVQMGPEKCLTGDKWDLDFPLVISGHIHFYHWLQSNIVYVGTAYQENFGEQEEKYVSWFQFRAGEDRAGEDRGEGLVEKEYRHENIDLHLPKKIHLHISYSQIITFEPPSEGIIKITLDVTRGERKQLGKIGKIKEWKARGIRMEYNTLPDILPEPEERDCYSVRYSYDQLLLAMIQDRQDLLELYQECSL